VPKSIPITVADSLADARQLWDLLRAHLFHNFLVMGPGRFVRVPVGQVREERTIRKDRRKLTGPKRASCYCLVP
jgi:hypothetical protein